MEPIQAGYVVTPEGDYYIQLPSDSRWGFTIYSDDQAWEGGFGGPGPLRLVPDDDVPEEVRDTLGWIFDEMGFEPWKKGA